MTKIKIMSVRDEDMPYIKAWAEKHHVEVDITKEALTDDNVEGVAGYDGLSRSQQIPLSEHVYKRLNELGIKQIAQRSAGFDTYDLELAVNQAINVVRHFNQIQTKVREHDFRWEPTILSKSIKDLKVAVIGTGRIGRVVADIFANGYQSDVVAYDPFPNAKIATYVDYKDTIEEAVEGADIVTLHVPATKYNHYLFNAELFKHFKKGAVFVNCARGSLVDTKALLDALDNGVIKGAALDTYEFERKLFPSDQRGKTLNDPLLESLIDREDVILTPHIAFYTEAAVKNLIVDALDATLDVLQTGDTRLRVN
ncbi:TPA: D-lactate dehydrogenase [Staphylococcus aureus]|uniref:D-lactate dehydrogenase n=1 Tax=Staphylococcus aureus TaxID=1280 RepID=UPI0012AF9790|nr:D-lactate dehydrogenase [Staphylococcus aureus]MRU84760.1 D-lactate dehydrogenase [Staphylococcus aureus]NGV63317.1 D-lactate dehydrogenase [Staphylococcus aureus]HAR5351071.1 D-lactate dehydrogenase [Staphylococcus aureus]HDA4750605.1 D-lactate dehydrogenase [Staphylococcus aureus]HDE6996936.1 D-lactate dehydrogenase [Staphylococcus aureus]